MVEDHGLLFDGRAAVGKATLLIHCWPLGQLCRLQSALKRLEDSSQQKQVEADEYVPQDWVFTVSPHFLGRGKSLLSQPWSAKRAEDLGTQKKKSMVGVSPETVLSIERQVLLGKVIQRDVGPTRRTQSPAGFGGASVNTEWRPWLVGRPCHSP